MQRKHLIGSVKWGESEARFDFVTCRWVVSIPQKLVSTGQWPKALITMFGFIKVM